MYGKQFCKIYMAWIFCTQCTVVPSRCCGSGSRLDPDSMGSLDPYPDSRGQKWHRKKRKQLIHFIFWSAGCSLFRAESFFWSSDVLYGGLRISKLQLFDPKKRNNFQLFFFSFFDHQNSGSVSGSGSNESGSTTTTTTLCCTSASRSGKRMTFLNTSSGSSTASRNHATSFLKMFISTFLIQKYTFFQPNRLHILIGLVAQTHS